jgi:predicted esterase YcpF (UPF0227 family)
MTALLYIHGFLSSPQSFKARVTRDWLAEHRPEVTFLCPHLTPYPDETAATLQSLVETHLDQPLGLIGSSLGGFWASWLVETYGLRALLVNPAVDPWQFMPAYVEVDLKGWHTDDSYRLNSGHIAALHQYHRPITRHANYWLLAQTGDETLDYRQAQVRYQGCRQTIEPGGDHSFQGFERFLPEAVNFLLARRD